MANSNGGIVGVDNPPVVQPAVITTFNSSGTLTTAPYTSVVNFLVIAGGGGGGGVPRICSRIHLPRRTGEVRVGLEVMVRMLACVRMPPRWLSGSSLTRWNASPFTLEMP